MVTVADCPVPEIAVIKPWIVAASVIAIGFPARSVAVGTLGTAMFVFLSAALRLLLGL